MTDATRRAIRTFVQVGLVQGVMLLWNAFAPVQLSALQMIAITTVATPIVGLIQNLLEDAQVIPPLLKPPVPVAPVVVPTAP